MKQHTFKIELHVKGKIVFSAKFTGRSRSITLSQVNVIYNRLSRKMKPKSLLYYSELIKQETLHEYRCIKKAETN